MDGVGFDHFPNSGTLRFVRFKAKQIAGRYGFHHDEDEDIQQTLIAHCLERMASFDPRRSNSQTFTRILINRGIATIVESKKARCRDYRLCQRSLDAPCNRADSMGGGLAGDTAEDDYGPAGIRSSSLEKTLLFKLDVDRAIAALPPELQQICHLLMVIDGIAEVAIAAGISRATLHRRMRAIRTQFIKARLSDHFSEAPTNKCTRLAAGLSSRGS